MARSTMAQHWINLSKLRPGDLVFVTARDWTSRAIRWGTLGRYSHVAIVIFPDLWFETDGQSGAGLRVHRHLRATLEGDVRTFACQLPYSRISILRLHNSAITYQMVLAAVAQFITLQYPKKYEFLPIFYPFRWFPRTTDRFIDFLSGRDHSKPYCSQLVCRMIEALYPAATGYDVGGHITPSALRFALQAQSRDVTSEASLSGFEGRVSDGKLLGLIYNLRKVGRQLMLYQEPRDPKRWTKAIARLSNFGSVNLPTAYNLAKLEAALKRVLTLPKFFCLHDAFWFKHYT